MKVIVNETGETPKEIVNQTTSWSGQHHNSIYGQSAFEVFGHCLVSLWEVSISYGELAHVTQSSTLSRTIPRPCG